MAILDFPAAPKSPRRFRPEAPAIPARAITVWESKTVVDPGGTRAVDAVRVAWWRWYEMVVGNTVSAKCMVLGNKALIYDRVT